MRFAVRALVVAVASLALAAPAFADTTYHDTTGETPGAADISTVVASNIASGDSVSFQITVANAAAVKSDTSFYLYFDTDRDARTGDPHGYEYAAVIHPVGWAWARWDGTNWVSTGALIQGIFLDDVMTVTISNQGLGDVKAFSFRIVSVRGSDPDHLLVDDAPNTDEIWTYTLAKSTVGTPIQPVTTPAPPVRVTGANAIFGGVPTGGRPFVVRRLTVDLSSGAHARAAKVACTATLAGKPLAGTGAGGCTFRLAKDAKGRRLALHVTGLYGRTKLGRSYAFTVR